MTLTRRSEWLVPSLLVLLSASNARFFAQPLPVVLHILSVLPYSILGAFQFAPGFRRRRRGWHRMAGGIVAICGMILSLAPS